MHFAKRRGEFALRLAMHAAVPQGIQPELLHLLKRNFVPEAGDDPTLEADILFSPLCEELGRGFFSFDPQVRSLLLENLASNYAAEPESRIAKVADFLLAYVDHHDRSTSGAQDRLWRDYLEMQRWVAFAFVDPAGAAQQLAAALENADASDDFVARIQLGGLASALAAPLARFPSLLNYAAGLQALELGDRARADELFESLKEQEIKIGNVTLRPASRVLNDWQTRHPEFVAPPQPEPEAVDMLVSVEELLVRIRSKNVGIRRQAAEKLGGVGAFEEPVAALIDALGDRSVAVRLASVDALARIGTETAWIGLTTALTNVSAVVGSRAYSLLKDRPLALIVGDFSGKGEILYTFRDAILRASHLPVYLGYFELSDRRFLEISKSVRFVIADVTGSRGLIVQLQRRELERALRLRIPVQPIAQFETRFPSVLSDLQPRPLLRTLLTYNNVQQLTDILDKTIPEIVSGAPTKEPKPRTFAHDVFISYARADRDQVVALSEHLKHRLSRLTGKPPNIYIGSLFITTDEAFPRVSEAIDKSAVFLVYLSGSFLASEWCRSELERIRSTVALQPGGESRIIKVLRHPVSLEEQPIELRPRSSFEFYEVDESSGQVLPLRPASEAPDYGTYGEKMNELAWEVMRALEVAGVRHVESTQSAVAPEQTLAPVKVLLLYTHRDAKFRDELTKHLIPLEHQRLIRFHEERIIMPGTEWAAEISKDRASAQLILLLMSPDFIVSDVVWGDELKHVLRRAKAGEILLIPIIVRAADWHNSPYGILRPLPSNEVPVNAWSNRDEAYVDIARGIQTTVEAFNLIRKERTRPEPDTARREQKTPAIDRWPVRTGTDRDAIKVIPRPVTTTVEELIAQPRPSDMPLSGKAPARYQSGRAEPVETTTCLLDVDVIGFRRSVNRTYRLILQGSSGATMIAKVPDPKRMNRSSVWFNSVSEVRKALEERLQFTNAYTYVDPPLPAQMIGIGHFGRPHGQTGAAANGVEIHPIISFKWLPPAFPEESQTTVKRRRRGKRRGTGKQSESVSEE